MIPSLQGPSVGRIFVLSLCVLAPAGCVDSGNAQDQSQASAPHHGWVLAPYHGLSSDTGRELWDSPQDLCDATNALASAMADAQQKGQAPGSVSLDAPGRHELPAGTWVDIVGHATSNCAGTPMHFTRVRIRDGGSHLNNHVLYLIEGELARQ